MYASITYLLCTTHLKFNTALRYYSITFTTKLVFYREPRGTSQLDIRHADKVQY